MAFQPAIGSTFRGCLRDNDQVAKRAIQAILGTADVTDEELMTAMIGAEVLINSRLLTYQSANPADDVPLTPNHFIHGQIGGHFAPISCDDTDFNPRK